MKTIKFKQIFSLITIAVLSLTASIFAVVAINNKSNNSGIGENSVLGAKITYDMSNFPDNIALEIYKAALNGDKQKVLELYGEYFFEGGKGLELDPFIIDNELNLKNFATYVNNGNCCEGLYFKMTADISLSGQNFAGIGVNGTYKGEVTQIAFKGHFDGNGHTISNINITNPDVRRFYDGDLHTATETTLKLGFFASLNSGSSVKRLKLKDITLNVYVKTTGRNIDVGGIAGDFYRYANDRLYTDIEECMVENLTINNVSGVSWVDTRIGGIVGVIGSSLLKCRLSNCYVNGMTVSSSFAHNPDNNEYLSGFVGRIGSSIEMRDMVFQNDSDNIECLVYFDSLDAKLESVYSNIYWEKNIPKDWKNALSSISDAEGPSGTVWYYDSGYEPIPQLRLFIDWKKCGFEVNGNASMSKSYLYYPSDYSGFKESVSGNVVAVLAETVLLTSNFHNGHYESPVWTFKKSSKKINNIDCDVYYTTTLTVTKVKLWIYESQNVTVETGAGYTGELVDGCYTIEFNCGQEIQCYFNEPYIKSGAYRSFCINVPITGLDGYSMLIEFTAKEGYYFLKHENSFSLELQFACMLFPGENVESSHSSGDTIILYLHDDMQILFEYHEKGTENEIYNALQEKTYGVEID